MNRFTAYRTLDISDTHTADQVNPPDEAQYEGIVFDNGKCALNWLTAVSSISLWDSFEDAMRIHGHPEYGTRIVFHDKVLPLPWEMQRCDCCCVTCHDAKPVHHQRMIVCPVCGNKRCPKANNHDYTCTNSNRSGQAGSAYP
ncbi:MAG: hypothetical protein HOA06_10065 [Chloroflexi bacterium]|mgnify:CR=1 FL=1|jgi:hypothetical protein|nr:hypothetical protein [Chloroflexota bacterium]MBT7538637.1 hypothetical protein [Gammaproteobacteria bacterium]